jgi:hypothetical protein
MEIIHSIFKVAHQTVDIPYGRIGGCILRNQHQCLPVVIQCFSIFSVERQGGREEKGGEKNNYFSQSTKFLSLTCIFIYVNIPVRIAV